MSVSLLIYLASVSGGVFSVCVTATFLLSVVVGVSIFGFFICSTVEKNEEYRNVWSQVLRKTYRWLILSVFLTIVVPTQVTVYAITAALLGEQIVKSEEVQGVASDATKALQFWIKKQLDEQKKQERE